VVRKRDNLILEEGIEPVYWVHWFQNCSEAGDEKTLSLEIEALISNP
jgi:hypothetical protein